MESCGRVGAHKCGGLEHRDSILTDLVSMFCLFGHFAVHGNIFATEETGKKCKEVQLYGIDMKKEASLW